MEQTTYVSRLRYLDADDLDDSVVDFDGVDVRASDGEKLGDLDGFLVDPSTSRVLYAVVDSGGWFSSRRFLLPIGHVTVDPDGGALRADVTRGRLEAFPEFDERRFNTLSDDDFRTYQSQLSTACCPDDTRATWDERRHYAQPSWWSASAYSAARLRPIESRPYRDTMGAAAAGSAIRPADDRGSYERHTHGSVTHSHPGGDRPHTHERERELVTARDTSDHDARHDRGARDADDVSPHFGGRAQPGDVLGLETGGETTGLGDSAEDENKRRRDAERRNS